jgi:hypothetical protein
MEAIIPAHIPIRPIPTHTRRRADKPLVAFLASPGRPTASRGGWGFVAVGTDGIEACSAVVGAQWHAFGGGVPVVDGVHEEGVAGVEGGEVVEVAVKFLW